VRLGPAIAAIALATALAGCSSGDGGGRADNPVVSFHPPSSTAAPTTSAPASRTSATHRPTRPPTTARHNAPPPTTSSAPPPAPLPAVHAGLVVVLNPGHNGGNGAHAAEINRQVYAGFGAYKACDTTGTVTNGGYPEHAFNWDVTLRVRHILQMHGVHVILTRPDDTGVGPCVDQRAAIGNQQGVDAVVSIHADGAPSSGHGFHVNLDSRTPEGATQTTQRLSKRLGTDIHDALAASSGLVPSTYIGTDGYYYRSDLAGLNLSKPPTTFLELGNMKNSGDAALQTSAEGRQRIAHAVAAGILAYLAQR
jgi:N-acetylmuramoyl-L-alanine amidase